jgi:hypothetical protein
VFGEAAAGLTLGQGLFDWFCRDMDGSLREMGVGARAAAQRLAEQGEEALGRIAFPDPEGMPGAPRKEAAI